jgi:hypothetical protein
MLSLPAAAVVVWMAVVCIPTKALSESNTEAEAETWITGSWGWYWNWQCNWMRATAAAAASRDCIELLLAEFDSGILNCIAASIL